MNLQAFFAEKDLDERYYEVSADDGTVNMIPTSMVIAAILQTEGEERRKVISILSQLDQRNGDIHHFLRHLAQAMAIRF
jgi:hypothetical protein